jgi:hypothetical protein
VARESVSTSPTVRNRWLPINQNLCRVASGAKVAVITWQPASHGKPMSMYTRQHSVGLCDRTSSLLAAKRPLLISDAGISDIAFLSADTAILPAALLPLPTLRTALLTGSFCNDRAPSKSCQLLSANPSSVDGALVLLNDSFTSCYTLIPGLSTASLRPPALLRAPS